MKIIHICLCGPVTDNWTYQDNLLPKYHKRLGYDVSVITSEYIWNKNGELDVDYRNVYFNENNIKTIRIKTKYGTTVESKFKKYKNLYRTIWNENPDIIFVHGIQFFDVKEVIKYKKKNPDVKVFVDNHADFSNSATNWLSKNILHKLIWRYYAKSIEPYVIKFYGVLPARVDFLKDMYKIQEDKVDLLVLGADDDKVKEARKNNVKIEIRNMYDIKENDFLIITGGKIDFAKKQTLLLMKAIQILSKSYKNLKLIVFGSVANDLKEELKDLVDDNNVQYIGWIKPEDSYNYFGAADLVVFPGRHSVFWEQVVGLGIPMVVKYWYGTTHIEIGGNCKYLYTDSVEEIKEVLENIINDGDEYKNMKLAAITKGKEKFSYEKIAYRSIND